MGFCCDLFIWNIIISECKLFLIIIFMREEFIWNIEVEYKCLRCILNDECYLRFWLIYVMCELYCLYIYINEILGVLMYGN